mmetsp:Transcript_8829/g.21493  ORF Transcript_8829/g.21493 Transcript_8829/m.21493 type:complete len:209 (-) Transcript_8829:926-1552(-)
MLCSVKNALYSDTFCKFAPSGAPGGCCAAGSDAGGAGGSFELVRSKCELLRSNALGRPLVPSRGLLFSDRARPPEAARGLKFEFSPGDGARFVPRPAAAAPRGTVFSFGFGRFNAGGSISMRLGLLLSLPAAKSMAAPDFCLFSSFFMFTGCTPPPGYVPLPPTLPGAAAVGSSASASGSPRLTLAGVERIPSFFRAFITASGRGSLM